MKYKEIQGMSVGELTKKVQEFRAELFELGMKNTMGQQVTNPLKIRHLRRDIARGLTALNKKQSEAGRSK